MGDDHGPRLLVTDDAQLRELAHGSGISVASLARNGIETIDSREARKRLGQRGDNLIPDASGPCISFPYRLLQLDGVQTYSIKTRLPLVEFVQVGKRLDQVRKEERKYQRAGRKRLATGLAGTVYEHFGVHPFIPMEVLNAFAAGELAGVPVVILEGEKKALCLASRGVAAVAIPGVGCWGSNQDRNGRYCKKGTPGSRKVMHPDLRALIDAGAKLVVLFDADRVTNKDVAGAEIALVAAIANAGGEPYLAKLPLEPGGPKGVDDFVMQLDDAHRIGQSSSDGRAFVESVVDRALENGPAAQPDTDKGDGRRRIYVSPRQHEVNDQVNEALLLDPALFQRGKRLVRVEQDPAFTPPRVSIGSVDRDHLQHRISKVCRFLDVDAEGNEKEKNPPSHVSGAALSRKDWLVPALRGVVSTPVLRPDGTILAETGYDPATKLWCQLNHKYPAVPTYPSAAQVRTALSELRSVVCDFPFANSEHVGKEVYEAAWLAAPLTLAAFNSYNGCTPIFVADASVRGAAKTLAQLLAIIIACGELPKINTLTGDQADEERKLLTSVALESPRYLVLDNVVGRFGSGPICAMATTTIWGDRVLGENKSMEAPISTVVFANGNNIAMKRDADRRIVYLRLEPQVERPEHRGGFKHPLLKEWALANHPQLLSHVLTLLRGYFGAGCPDQGLRSWGSFEEFSAVVRNTLVWAGAADPYGAVEEVFQHAAPEDVQMDRLLEEWQVAFGGKGATPAQAIRMVWPEVGPYAPDYERNPHPGLCEVLEERFGTRAKVDAQKLGYWLSDFRGRVFGGRLLVKEGSKGRERWVVKGEAPPRAETKPEATRGEPDAAGFDEGFVDDEFMDSPQAVLQ